MSKFVAYFGKTQGGEMVELDYNPSTHFSAGVPKQPWTDGGAEKVELIKNEHNLYGFGAIQTWNDWLANRNVTDEEDRQLAYQCQLFFTHNSSF